MQTFPTAFSKGPPDVASLNSGEFSGLAISLIYCSGNSSETNSEKFKAPYFIKLFGF